ncbi:heterokaryon incompatibility protein-domain-containing protein [Scleroderma yunnanense]
MRLINIKAFLEREESIRKKKRVDRQTKVLECHDDESQDYAILSHRWTDQEVSYDEVIWLTKMEKNEQDRVRRHLGYRKILDSCEQAKKDGCEWLWIDTCCIDKQSSAEISEAINSMYRWYENSKICYAYLHDVPGTSFPTASDDKRYPNSNGWPEWFSRGWTLQEMIAPRHVQFFNKDWQRIGDKKTLARTLSRITRVPQLILTDGLSSNRPCVAQIMSWAANRTTTRVEDRAYCLLGLLDVNMVMLYGEGKKAFHRLQLEIIRMSNDQSIFAWDFLRKNGRTGSILADDPSFFRDCNEMVLMDYDEFTKDLKDYIPEAELHSIEEDRFGTFPVTNRGIQIWLLYRPLNGTRSVFQAWLPCCPRPFSLPVSINLALWKSNYYRYTTSLWDGVPTEKTLQFRQLYLRYQDTPHRDATFEIDDGAITEHGFTYCGTYPSNSTESTLTLTRTDPLRVKIYSNSKANCRFAVGFGQCLGQDWIHFVYEEDGQCPWEDYAKEEYKKMLIRGPDHARSMAEARSSERHGRVCIMQTSLPRSTWTVRTSCVLWESSRRCGARIEVLRYAGYGNAVGKWTGFDVEGTDDPNCDMQGLMIRHKLWRRYTLLVGGISMKFLPAPKGIKLGDYGHFTESDNFRCEGNVFIDLKSLSSKADTTNITPKQHNVYEKHGCNTDGDYVKVHQHNDRYHVNGPPVVTLYKPLGLSLPRNLHFNSFLASLSTRLMNRYLVTWVIECATVHSSELSRQSSRQEISYRSPTLDPTTPLCIIAKPLAWYQNDDNSSALVE